MLEQLDISFVMKQKALNGYSMDIEKNKKLSDAFGTQELKVCWSWLASTCPAPPFFFHLLRFFSC
jgi:hypothetical protein